MRLARFFGLGPEGYYEDKMSSTTEKHEKESTKTKSSTTAVAPAPIAPVSTAAVSRRTIVLLSKHLDPHQLASYKEIHRVLAENHASLISMPITVSDALAMNIRTQTGDKEPRIINADLSCYK